MKKRNLLWVLRLLGQFLSPGVDDDVIITDGDDAGDGDDTGADGDDAGDGDDTGADGDDAGDGDDTGGDTDPAPRPVSRAQKAIIETRARAQKAEADLALAQAQLAEARRGPAGPAQKTADQELWEQEEAVLRNPEADQWQKYAVTATRTARIANASSNAALQRAEDLADKTAFAAIAATKPKLYAAYKDRVEEKLKEARASGANPSRENVLRFMVGEDMLSGKLKTTESKSAKPSAAPRAGVRSDVTASNSGRLSEAEKRTRRLENVRI